MEQINYDKSSLKKWYEKNHAVSDILIDWIKENTKGNYRFYEGLMHTYISASKLVNLKYVVNRKEYPELFSSYFPVVEWIRKSIRGITISANNQNKIIAYWLLCGDMYNELVDRVIMRIEESKNRKEIFALKNLMIDFISTSIRNGIKDPNEWAQFFSGDKNIEIDFKRQNIIVDKIIAKSYATSETTEVVNTTTKQSKTYSPSLNSDNTDTTDINDIDIKEDYNYLSNFIDDSYNKAERIAALTFLLKKGAGTYLKKGVNIAFDKHFHAIIEAPNKKGKKLALLAYFCFEVAKRVGLASKTKDKDDFKISWKFFQTLFEENGFATCKRDWKNNGLPLGYEEIDDLFV